MGTKTHPGPYDCYDKADPDEPLFVLRAKDPVAPFLVRQWVRYTTARLIAENKPLPMDKFGEALTCAGDMETWRFNNWQKQKGQR